jgi:hypothetical protein
MSPIPSDAEEISLPLPRQQTTVLLKKYSVYSI